MPNTKPKQPENSPPAANFPPISSDFAVEWWDIDRPKDYPQNARRWSAEALAKVGRSIREFGWRQPVVVDEAETIIIGHLRRAAARQEGLKTCPVHMARGLSPEQVRALRLADNRTHEESSWNLELLGLEFAELRGFEGFDLSVTGFDLHEIEDALAGAGPGGDASKLAERFGVPPFSVLDARQGYWQERKRAWLALGIQSELGRGDVMPSGASSVYSGSSEWAGTRGPKKAANSLPGGSLMPAANYRKRERGNSRSGAIPGTAAKGVKRAKT